MADFSGVAGKTGLTFSTNGSFPDSRGVGFLVAGELRNLNAIAHELALPANCDEHALLAAAHERWGADLVAHLRGRFAILVWDPRTSEGFVAVDQLGAGSLFYASSQGELVFATEVGDLLDALTSTPPLDELAVAQWIADGLLQRGRTLYSGVSRLTGGSRIRIDRAGWSIERYWSPQYREPLNGSRAELSAELREQITAAVRRAAPSKGRIGTLLSGGLDSSAIAAVATSCGETAAYSMTFSNYPSVDETPFIDAVTERLHIRSRRREMHPSSLLAPGREFLRRWAWPSISPALYQNLEVARLARDDEIDVLFDGEGGDELFAAPPYLIADALSKGRVPTALRLARQLAGMGDAPPPRVVRWVLREYGLKGLVPRSFHTGARRVRGVGAYALPWLSDRSRRLLEPTESSWDWKANRSGPRWWSQRVELLTAWRESLGSHDYLRRKSAMAGVRDAHPFLDDLDLAEFVLRLPPEQAFDAQLTRPLLREAMVGLLPDDVRLRTHKATFNEYIGACLAGPDWAELVALIGAPDAEVNAFVRPEVVRAMYLDPSPERPPEWIGVVWRLAGIELWLRQLVGRDASPPLTGDVGVGLANA